MRIVSLLPSATEIVYALGLGDQLHGVTHQCDFPENALTKPILVKPFIITNGLTSLEIDQVVSARLASGQPIYHVDQEGLIQANPDLILTQKICDVCAVSFDQVQKLEGIVNNNTKVLSLDVHSFDDMLSNIIEVGTVAGVENVANLLVVSMKKRLALMKKTVSELDYKPRVICIEWLDPLMVGGHWIPELVHLAGGVDCIGERGQPSKTITWDEFQQARPDFVLVMPCGFDTKQGKDHLADLMYRRGWDSLPGVDMNKVCVLDGNSYFSRSGPRLLDGLEIIFNIIHPDL
ncbi:MAG: cobalamin-binding protein [Dehalococcoidia bacterium]|nr:cobalamin-binding protein [Dehalococcoidia bacterium]